MFVCPSFCAAACLSVRSLDSLSIYCFFVCLSDCLSNCLFVCLSACLSVRVRVVLSGYLLVCVLSVCCPFVCLRVCMLAAWLRGCLSTSTYPQCTIGGLHFRWRCNGICIPLRHLLILLVRTCTYLLANFCLQTSRQMFVPRT